jgi:hypothetical protein
MLEIFKGEAGYQVDNGHFSLCEKYDFERPKKVCLAMDGIYIFLHHKGTKFTKG